MKALSILAICLFNSIVSFSQPNIPIGQTLTGSTGEPVDGASYSFQTKDCTRLIATYDWINNKVTMHDEQMAFLWEIPIDGSSSNKQLVMVSQRGYDDDDAIEIFFELEDEFNVVTLEVYKEGYSLPIHNYGEDITILKHAGYVFQNTIAIPGDSTLHLRNKSTKELYSVEMAGPILECCSCNTPDIVTSSGYGGQEGVSGQDDDGFTLYPNPATRNGSLNFNQDYSGQLTIRTTDQRGRLLSIVKLEHGETVVPISKMKIFSSGEYFIVLETKTGMVKKLITVL